MAIESRNCFLFILTSSSVFDLTAQVNPLTIYSSLLDIKNDLYINITDIISSYITLFDTEFNRQPISSDFHTPLINMSIFWTSVLFLFRRFWRMDIYNNFQVSSNWQFLYF